MYCYVMSTHRSPSNLWGLRGSWRPGPLTPDKFEGLRPSMFEALPLVKADLRNPGGPSNLLWREENPQNCLLLSHETACLSYYFTTLLPHDSHNILLEYSTFLLRCSTTTLLLHFFPTLLLHYSTTLRHNNYPTLAIYYSTSLLLSHSPTQLPSYSTTRLRDYSIIPILAYSSTLLVYNSTSLFSPTRLLPYFITRPLYWSPTVLLDYFTTLLHYYFSTLLPEYNSINDSPTLLRYC